nr:type III-B CRISPR module RAMP protein Cmr6 [uncultured Ottowia sp.]
MPVAAVPAYLGRNFKNASPALRFGMLLPLWGVNRRTKELLWTTSDISHEVRGPLRQEREIKLNNKVDALAQAAALNPEDKAAMKALADRQSHLAGNLPHMLSLDATAIAPFTTGLGNEHPLENGFAFLNPYGLPYLAGSGVKGVLRQAARELASGQWGNEHGWSADKQFEIRINGKSLAISMLDALFGLESQDGDTLHMRGALSFWDVIPQMPNGTASLHVEVMTPHQSHYYQQKKDSKSGSSTTPHDSGQPTPISFLTVPPGSGMTFHMQCDLPRLQRLAPTLAEGDAWKKLLQAAFEHAFEWLGFGAKTAVGYGAMQPNVQATRDRKEKQREQKEQAERQARQAALSPAMRTVEAFVQELRAKHEQYPNYKEAPNGVLHGKARELAKTAHESADWSAEEKRAAAEAIETWLPKLVRVDIKDARKKLELGALKGQ